MPVRTMPQVEVEITSSPCEALKYVSGDICLVLLMFDMCT